MFESLSTKLQKITASMRGKARVTEADIKDMMKQIRMALLEADVNYQVTKDFVKDMQEKCLNADIEGSFTPGQQIVKIVHESLSELLGDNSAKINVSSSGFTVIMLYGLQGAGKTTTAVKLAKKTMLIVRENIVFALAVKFLVLILAAVGIANMWLAVFADVGVAVIAILNSMRALRASEAKV